MILFYYVSALTSPLFVLFCSSTLQLYSSGVGRNVFLDGPIQKWVGHLFPVKQSYEKLEEEEKQDKLKIQRPLYFLHHKGHNSKTLPIQHVQPAEH